MSEDDALVGLRVIGFHGVVRDRQTPARIGPVCVDENGHYVSVDLTSDGGVDLERSDERFDPTTFAEHGTAIDPHLQVEPGWDFVIVGAREREHLDLLEQGRSPVVQRLVRALRGARTDPFARILGSSVALYLPPHDAAVAWSELGNAARRHLDECCRRDDGEAIEAAGWWLKNAAADRNDELRAIAGLMRAGSRHVRGLAEAYFPEMNVNAALAEIANVEAALPSKASVAPGLPRRVPWSDSIRGPLRDPHVIQRREAA